MNSYKCCDESSVEHSEIFSQLSLLKLLADKNRLKILCILNTDVHAVGKITEHLGESQSLVSHHLMSLKEMALVSSQKEGREMRYSLSPKGAIVLKLLKILSKNKI